MNQLEQSKAVFFFLRTIPRGKISTYKAIANACNIKNPRTVGAMLHRNPDPFNYPCHRVVRSDGTIADGYAFGGKSEQIKILKEEGIQFESNGRIDKKFLFPLDIPVTVWYPF